MKLTNCKTTLSRRDEDMYIFILKGLRNTYNINSPALENVIECTNEKSSTRVRVYALKALASASCNEKSQHY